MIAIVRPTSIYRLLNDDIIYLNFKELGVDKNGFFIFYQL